MISRRHVFSRDFAQSGPLWLVRSLVSAPALLALVSIGLILTACPCLAQSGTPTGDDLSLFAGYLLPNDIDNVTDILPVFGGRYALAMPLGSVELEMTNTHSRGVDFTSFTASLRGEAQIGPGISGLIYGGPDLHWYIPQGDTQRHTDYGVHVGGAGLLMVTDAFWLRGDLKLNLNPGTALVLLFGIMLRTPGT